MRWEIHDREMDELWGDDGMARYKIIRVDDDEEMLGCILSVCAIGAVLYGIYMAGVFLMETLVYPFLLPDEKDMSESYYTKIVVTETVPHLEAQLKEYLESKGFHADPNSPKIYGNMRVGDREKVDRVKYLGSGNYRTVTTLYVELEYTDQNGVKQQQTNYYTYETASYIRYQRSFILVKHHYAYNGCNCIDHGLVNTDQSPHQFQSFQQ